MSARTRVFVPPSGARTQDAGTVLARERPDLQPLPPVATTGLIACYGPLVWLAIRLREGDTPTDPRLLRQQVWARLEEARERAEDQGIPAPEIEDAELILVALLDSAALARPGELRDLWKDKTLELERYRGTVAGHSFFEVLRRRMRGGASPELVELFYLALLAGFEGELAGRPGEVQPLMAELKRLLVSRPVPPQVSVRLEVDLPPAPIEHDGPSPWLLLGASFGFLALFACIVGVFVFVEARDAGALASELAQVLGGPEESR